MTATGSHIDFGFAARSTTLQGKAFSLSQRSQRQFLLLRFGKLAGEACLAPTVPRRGIYRNSAAYTPSVPFGDTSPYTGEPLFRRGNFFCIFLDFSMKLSQNCLEERESP